MNETIQKEIRKLMFDCAKAVVSGMPVLEGMRVAPDGIKVTDLETYLTFPRELLADIGDGHYAKKAVTLMGKGLKVFPDDMLSGEDFPTSTRTNEQAEPGSASKCSLRFWQACKAVAPACSKDETRHVLMLPCWSKQMASVAGTDGRRLHYVDKIEADVDVPAAMDGHPIGNDGKLCKLLFDFLAKEREDFETWVHFDKKASALHIDILDVYTGFSEHLFSASVKFVEGQYPNWPNVIPAHGPNPILFSIPEKVFNDCKKLDKSFEDVRYNAEIGKWTASDTKGVTVDMGPWDETERCFNEIGNFRSKVQFLIEACEFTGTFTFLSPQSSLATVKVPAQWDDDGTMVAEEKDVPVDPMVFRGPLLGGNVVWGRHVVLMPMRD